MTDPVSVSLDPAVVERLRDTARREGLTLNEYLDKRLGGTVSATLTNGHNGKGKDSFSGVTTLLDHLPEVLMLKLFGLSDEKKGLTKEDVRDIVDMALERREPRRGRVMDADFTPEEEEDAREERQARREARIAQYHRLALGSGDADAAKRWEDKLEQIRKEAQEREDKAREREDKLRDKNLEIERERLAQEREVLRHDLEAQQAASDARIAALEAQVASGNNTQGMKSELDTLIATSKRRKEIMEALGVKEQTEPLPNDAPFEERLGKLFKDIGEGSAKFLSGAGDFAGGLKGHRPDHLTNPAPQGTAPQWASTPAANPAIIQGQPPRTIADLSQFLDDHIPPNHPYIDTQTNTVMTKDAWLAKFGEYVLQHPETLQVVDYPKNAQPPPAAQAQQQTPPPASPPPPPPSPPPSPPPAAEEPPPAPEPPAKESVPEPQSEPEPTPPPETKEAEVPQEPVPEVAPEPAPEPEKPKKAKGKKGKKVEVPPPVAKPGKRVRIRRDGTEG